MKYFKHQTDMSMDVRVKRLIRKYGIEGYGLYNYILELVVRKLETQSPIPELEETAQDIAGDMGMDTLRVEEIMRYVIDQGLFDYDEVSGKIVANKVYKYLEQSDTRSKEIRNMIAAWKKGAKQGEIEMSETVRDNSEEEKRIEENRREKNGAKDDKKSATKKATHPSLHVPINQTRYDNLVAEYGEKTVDRYIQKAIDYCDSKGRSYYKDFAASAAQYIRRDEEQGKGPTKRQQETKPKINVHELAGGYYD